MLAMYVVRLTCVAIATKNSANTLTVCMSSRNRVPRKRKVVVVEKHHFVLTTKQIGLESQANEYQSRCLSPGPILGPFFFSAMQEVLAKKGGRHHLNRS